MAKKRTTLVSDFYEIVQSGDLAEFQKVFETCDINAGERGSKGNALHFYRLTEEMIRWFVGVGGDIDARNNYDRTPLHKISIARGGKLNIYIELGADVNATDCYGNTPLHFAAGSGFNAENVRVLLEHGANPTAKNNQNQTPLESALSGASNIDISGLAEISEMLLKYQPDITDDMRKEIRRIGETFEFHRANFNPEYIPETDKALEKLYRLFNVEPVARRKVFDGKSPITVTSDKWQKQFGELWDLLVPGSGHASTVQGEVIRICGKVTREIADNGAVNWSRNYKKLPQALPEYCAMGNQLEPDDYEQLKTIANGVSANTDIAEFDRLAELLVKWVLLNPNPIELKSVAYSR